MAKPVQDCLQIVREAHQQVKAKLTGTPFIHQLLEIDTLFRRLETKFEFMGAVVEPENFKQGNNDFPPITNFMGEAIDPVKKIDRAELNPKEAEKQKFREDVAALYKQISDLSPASVLNAYTIPEHELIVRGVAKRAGVEDYESKEMNVKFIEEIQVGIALKAEQEEKQAAIDAAAGKKAGNKILAQEDIDNDAELQKWNARPGDELIIGPNGKRSIKKPK